MTSRRHLKSKVVFSLSCLDFKFLCTFNVLAFYWFWKALFGMLNKTVCQNIFSFLIPETLTPNPNAWVIKWGSNIAEGNLLLNFFTITVNVNNCFILFKMFNCKEKNPGNEVATWCPIYSYFYCFIMPHMFHLISSSRSVYKVWNRILGTCISIYKDSFRPFGAYKSSWRVRGSMPLESHP